MERGRRPWSGGAEIVSIGRTTTSLFGRADARRERDETGEEALPKFVRTSPSCPGVRPEAKAIDVARRDARRRS